jgi:hypothetical protein
MANVHLVAVASWVRRRRRLSKNRRGGSLSTSDGFLRRRGRYFHADESDSLDRLPSRGFFVTTTFLVAVFVGCLSGVRGLILCCDCLEPWSRFEICGH